MRIGLAVALALLTPLAVLAREPALSDAQVRTAIIRESVDGYHSMGRPCACPYDLMRNGAACGGRSAYSRPGGASPICYPQDVTPDMIETWRRRSG